jgi:hypothetical protein
MNMKFNLVGICLLMLLTACQKSKNVREYMGWVEKEENGLHKTKSIGAYEISLQYKPLEYIVTKEERKDRISEQTLVSRMEKLQDFQYFTLRLSSKDKQLKIMDIGNQTDQDYYNKVNYFSFGMQEDIYLVEDKDTLECKLFHFERNYDLAPYIDFLLAFTGPRSGVIRDKELVFEDKYLGIGPVKFIIDKSTLSNLPHLLTN